MTLAKLRRVRELQIVRVRTAAEMREALSVRRRVFVDEQGVPEAIEVDEHDGDPALIMSAVHVIGRLDGRAVAAGRLVVKGQAGENAHIGRVAVLREHRGRGYGRAIMTALHELARERGFDGVTLAAQLRAIGFYEALGYVAHGGVFFDAGIEHRWMNIDLSAGHATHESRPLLE